jgi:predicted nucleic acid-binding protein
MKLLDSNIIIYAMKSAYGFLGPILSAPDIYGSVINYVEVFGFHRLTNLEKVQLEQFFSNLTLLTLTPAVLDRAVQLRQNRPMKLGDSLIAATALVHNCTLITHNRTDLEWIPGLEVFDPLAVFR